MYCDVETFIKIKDEKIIRIKKNKGCFAQHVFVDARLYKSS